MSQTPKSEPLTVTSTLTGRLRLLKAYYCFSCRRFVDSEHARAILHEVHTSSSRPYIKENSSRESALRNPANNKNKTFLTRHPASERVYPGSYQHRNSATGYPHTGKNAPKPSKNPNLNHLRLKKVTTVFPFDTDYLLARAFEGGAFTGGPFGAAAPFALCAVAFGTGGALFGGAALGSPSFEEPTEELGCIAARGSNL